MAGWGDPHAAAMQEPHPPPSSQDSTFLRWIIGGGEDASAGMAGVMDPPALELDHATSMMSPLRRPFGP